MGGGVSKGETQVVNKYSKACDSFIHHKGKWIKATLRFCLIPGRLPSSRSQQQRDRRGIFLAASFLTLSPKWPWANSRNLPILTQITHHPINTFLLQNLGKQQAWKSIPVMKQRTQRTRNPWEVKALWKPAWSFLQKIKNGTPLWPRSTSPGHRLTEHLNVLACCYSVHNGKDWGQASSSLDEGTMKTYSYTIESYSAVKKTEIWNLQENA